MISVFSTKMANNLETERGFSWINSEYCGVYNEVRNHPDVKKCAEQLVSETMHDVIKTDGEKSLEEKKEFIQMGLLLADIMSGFKKSSFYPNFYGSDLKDFLFEHLFSSHEKGVRSYDSIPVDLSSFDKMRLFDRLGLEARSAMETFGDGVDLILPLTLGKQMHRFLDNPPSPFNNTQEKFLKFSHKTMLAGLLARFCIDSAQKQSDGTLLVRDSCVKLLVLTRFVWNA